MSELISRARALRNLAGQATAAADLTLVDGLISAATRAIEAYCSRSFGLVNRDELVDGRPYPTLWLGTIRSPASSGSPRIRPRCCRSANSAVSQAHVQIVDDGIQLAPHRLGEHGRRSDHVPFGADALRWRRRSGSSDTAGPRR